MKRSYDGTIIVKEKENVKLEESPGLKPKNLSLEGQNIWNDKYSNLSSERKILLETQEQTRLIRRISNNVLFYFWLIIISIILSLILLFIGEL